MQFISQQLYTTYILSVIAIAGTTAALVKVLYKPSTRFVAYKRRTVQHSLPTDELRLLVCTHHDRDVPPIAALLEASHPSTDSPICAYLLHLTPLAGQTNTVLAPYKKKKNHSSDLSSSDADHIVNAFLCLERNNPGCLTVVPFVGISPYASMHEDICSVAFDKKLTLVILPFHKSVEIDGAVQSVNPSVQLVNTNVLRYAPCSVGILIDHGLSGTGAHSLAVYFIGGADDREALAYAARLAENPAIALTVVRFLPHESDGGRDYQERLDDEAVDEFRMVSMDNKRVEYREEVVKDGAETVDVIRNISGDFNLLVVGRSYGRESAMTVGLEMGSEFPELGVIGDVLALTDFGVKVSTLVVQQQARWGREEKWWSGVTKVHPGDHGLAK